VFAVVAAVVVAAVVVAVVVGGDDGSGTNRAESDRPFDPVLEFNIGCAPCHGPNGDGGSAPKLSDGAVVERYPDIEDQIDVVANGRGLMPAFKERDMTDDEIREIVEYTRTQL
jgi:mono/diheme cytochrome c family protein